MIFLVLGDWVSASLKLQLLSGDPDLVKPNIRHISEPGTGSWGLRDAGGVQSVILVGSTDKLR